MDWMLVTAWVAICIGLAAAVFIYARNPAFWVNAVIFIFWKIWPLIWAFVSKRKSPEEEEKWRKEQLSGVKPPPKGTGVTTGNVIKQLAVTKKGKKNG